MRNRFVATLRNLAQPLCSRHAQPLLQQPNAPLLTHNSFPHRQNHNKSLIEMEKADQLLFDNGSISKFSVSGIILENRRGKILPPSPLRFADFLRRSGHHRTQWAFATSIANDFHRSSTLKDSVVFYCLRLGISFKFLIRPCCENKNLEAKWSEGGQIVLFGNINNNW